MKRPEMYLLSAGWVLRVWARGRREYLLSADQLPGKMSVVNARHLVLDVDETQAGEGDSSTWGSGTPPSSVTHPVSCRWVVMLGLELQSV